jgi:hypothetical protein
MGNHLPASFEMRVRIDCTPVPIPHCQCSPLAKLICPGCLTRLQHVLKAPQKQLSSLPRLISKNEQKIIINVSVTKQSSLSGETVSASEPRFGKGA